MAAGKWKLYDLAKKYLADGTHDLDDTTNWKIALFLSTSNANTLSVGTGVYGDLTNEHANANGYVTGGLTLTGEVWTNAAGVITFNTANPVWTASGGSIIARFAVIYRNATVNTIIKPLLCVCLLDTTPADVTTTTGNTLTIQMNGSGVFTLSGANVD
jgi:hypothetical protein